MKSGDHTACRNRQRRECDQDFAVGRIADTKGNQRNRNGGEMGITLPPAHFTREKSADILRHISARQQCSG